MQGVPQGAQRGNHRTRWAVRPSRLPRCAAATAGAVVGCALLSHLSLRGLCVLADDLRLLCWWLSPGLGSWEVDFTPCPLGWGILSYSLLPQLTPWSPLCLNLREPATLGLPFQSGSDAPWRDSTAAVSPGQLGAGDVSGHLAGPVGVTFPLMPRRGCLTFTLTPGPSFASFWVIYNSVNRQKGFSAQLCPSPRPGSPASHGKGHINRSKERGHCRTPENSSRRSGPGTLFWVSGTFSIYFNFIVVKYA